MPFSSFQINHPTLSRFAVLFHHSFQSITLFYSSIFSIHHSVLLHHSVSFQHMFQAKGPPSQNEGGRVASMLDIHNINQTMRNVFRRIIYFAIFSI